MRTLIVDLIVFLWKDEDMQVLFGIALIDKRVTMLFIIENDSANIAVFLDF